MRQVVAFYETHNPDKISDGTLSTKWSPTWRTDNKSDFWHHPNHRVVVHHLAAGRPKS